MITLAPYLTLRNLIIAAFLAVVVLLGVQTCRTVSLERKLTAAQLAPAKQATTIAQAKVETVTVRLAVAERTVTRTINSVRIDTLLIDPKTAADTATALVQLPALAAAHDSLQRSCAAFVLTCGEFRAASESRDSAQRRLIDGLQEALRTARPSRIGAVWSRVKLPLAFVGGVYVGTRVIR